MVDFTSISYLGNGNLKQRTAYEILTKYGIMDILQDFDPIIVGTIPIGIDIDSSDLDIICFWQDQNVFRQTLIKYFGRLADFLIRDVCINNQSTTVANFRIGHLEFEIFGQNVPSKSQFGYRHMLVENRLLAEKGEDFRKEIIVLKQRGYKTEPAFAKVLGMEGDPYPELLKLEILDA
ncbi:DUF4269 domain-containing protein [Dyadobacter sp. CY345]|uniref:DUF4269 domain-containing protein n=1 Tax=Dyadobacter sp. CY345 TaxID=2909335 RepID=UPI001F1E9EA3|nr:DUF4269 domain-containing protein [Dyadobacter sp. CY345]MCF2443579.1 DUF4269 domain-containing protein [Dyadobacter sp. CY345]